MYLSCLLIDVGTNPDRPRPGRLWLRNLYRVHQRLCMAFPSADRKRDDPQFLQPHAPGDFAQHHVHTKRSSDCGFLFRIDPQPGANPVIVVQSADRPDWEYAFHNARHFLAAPPEPTPYNPQLLTGQVFQFRLLPN
ncbi:MAG TPA: type I-E CRISPR-associated protein Cas6/Cse3/CasE, partial [Planctomycetota bacterium]|nr:type I-E CRISPR-associated protein Cas6/Cse3/CasE [Planctomycetota bacterium]